MLKVLFRNSLSQQAFFKTKVKNKVSGKKKNFSENKTIITPPPPPPPPYKHLNFTFLSHVHAFEFLKKSFSFAFFFLLLFSSFPSFSDTDVPVPVNVPEVGEAFDGVFRAPDETATDSKDPVTVACVDSPVNCCEDDKGIGHYNCCSGDGISIDTAKSSRDCVCHKDNSKHGPGSA